MPVPTKGAVKAAATGMRPENRVARSAPMRWMPEYQQTNPMTVTITACHSRAAASVESGTRSQSPPSASTPMTADSAAAIPHTVAERSLGPSGRSTGTARTAKPTSPASAPTEKRMPIASARPHPCTVKAPAATINAPYMTARCG